MFVYIQCEAGNVWKILQCEQKEFPYILVILEILQLVNIYIILQHINFLIKLLNISPITSPKDKCIMRAHQSQLLDMSLMASSCMWSYHSNHLHKVHTDYR